jgi:DNA-binding Lrp family transcriptional regulator
MIENFREKLDIADRRILFELDKNCRITDTKLAKKVRKSREAVRYRIKRLIERGIITSFTTSINPARLGYSLYKIYLQLENIEKERQKLLQYLRNNKRVYWMGECDGAWDLIFAIYAKNDMEFYRIKNELISDFQHIIINKATGRFIDAKQYVKRFFTGELIKPVVFGGEIINNKIDEKEYRILEVLIANARTPINEIARIVKTTPSIVRSSIRKMEKLEIILAYRIGINLQKLGLEMFKAIVYLKGMTEERENDFYNYVYSIDNICYFIRNITPWDIELEFVVENYNKYTEIIADLRRNFPDVIRNVETVLMRTDEWMPGCREMIKNSKIRSEREC